MEKSINKITQAIVIADSFVQKFYPISLECPKVLFPIANIPIIDYVIEFLVSNGIEEIFILSVTFDDKIQKHLEQMKYHGLHFYSYNSATNIVELLNEIRRYKNIPIENDFILMRGDVIANLNLEEAIKEHFAHKSSSSSDTKKNSKVKYKCLMTKLFLQSPLDNSLRTKNGFNIITTLPDEHRILRYENISDKNALIITNESIQGDSLVEIRSDLYDCEISICSPEIFSFLNDNFTVKNLNEDFINDVCFSKSLSNDRIFYYEFQSGYCSIVSNMLVYSEISKHLMARIVYPLTIEKNLLCPNYKFSFKYLRNNIYVEDEISLGKSAKLIDKIVIGKKTIIGENTAIQCSTVGRNCFIGDNCKIENSYIWNNVRIEDGCKINGAIICDNVHIKKHTQILPGCVISFNIVVKEDETIEKNSSISIAKRALEKNASTSSKFKNSDSFENGTIFLYSGDDWLKEYERIGGRPYYLMMDELKSVIEFEGDKLSESLGFSEKFESKKSTEFSENNLKMERRFSISYYSFSDDVKTILYQYYQKLRDSDKTIGELTSLKLSENRSQSELLLAGIPIILDNLIPSKLEDPKKITEKLTSNFLFWKIILSSLFKGEISEAYSIIHATEHYCSQNDFVQDFFHLLIQLYHQNNIISNDLIFKWAKEKESNSTTIKNRMYQNLLPFIEYLKDEDEESDEDSKNEEQDDTQKDEINDSTN